jgi:hypothetical protein
MLKFILKKFGFRLIEEKTYKAVKRSLTYCYASINFEYKGLSTFEKKILSRSDFKELTKIAKDVE